MPSSITLKIFMRLICLRNYLFVQAFTFLKNYEIQVPFDVDCMFFVENGLFNSNYIAHLHDWENFWILPLYGQLFRIFKMENSKIEYSKLFSALLSYVNII